MDIATLGLKVDATQVVTAKTAVDQLTQSGAKAEQAFRRFEQTSKSAGGGLRQLGSLARTAQVALGAIGVTVGINALIRQIGEANAALDEMTASARRLEGSARLAGVGVELLNQVASQAREEFLLSSTAANDYATQVARAAERTGDFTLAQEGLAAVMNIAAREGISSERALNAFRQALIGVDEGTDLLLGKNPSELFDATADSAERAAAVIEALIAKSAAMGGSFQDSITDVQRAQAEANRELERAQVAFAEAYSPLRIELINAQADALREVADAITENKEGLAELIEFLVSVTQHFVETASAAGRFFSLFDPDNMRRALEERVLGITPVPSFTPAGGSPFAANDADRIAASNRRNAEERARQQALREREKAAKEAAEAAAREQAALAAQVDLLSRAAELRVLGAQGIQQALDLERRLRRELENSNLSLERRVFLSEQLANLPSFRPGPLTPVMPGEVPRTPREDFLARGGTLTRVQDPNQAEKAAELERRLREEQIRTFNEQIQAVREVISVFGDLSFAGEDLAGVFRGAQTILGGVGRFQAAGDGVLGFLGQGSGILSILGGGFQILEGLLFDDEEADERERQRQEIERANEALRQFAESLRDISDLERRRADALDLLAGSINAAQAGSGDFSWVTSIIHELIEAGASTQEILQHLQRFGVGIRGAGDDINGLIEGIEEYREALKAIEEQRQREVDRMKDDISVRILAAQGRSEEAEALRRQIERERELAKARELEDDALVEMLTNLYELEDAALAAAKAAEEAAKALSIELFDMEIAARRAALAGDDLTAMQIKGEAEIKQQIAAWEELVAAGKMTEEQLLALSEIMREELARSIEAAAAAAERAKMSFLQSVEFTWLQMFGAPGEAERFRIQADAERQREEARRLLENDPEKLAAVLQKIDEIEARMLAQLEGGGVGGAAARGRDMGRDEVLRSVTGITEMQANRLIDVQMSALTSLREISFNTSVLRAGDGAALPTFPGVAARPSITIEVRIDNISGVGAGDARTVGWEIGRRIAEDRAFVQALNKAFGFEVGSESRLSGDARVS